MAAQAQDLVSVSVLLGQAGWHQGTAPQPVGSSGGDLGGGALPTAINDS